MACLKYYGSDLYLDKFKRNITFEDFSAWLKDQDIYSLDIETNVTSTLVSKTLVLLQFSDVKGEYVYEIQYSYLSEDEKEQLIVLLDNVKQLKLIHNAIFEYTVLCQVLGVRLKNIWDTFNVEKVIAGGKFADNTFFKLNEVLLRRYNIEMSKELQTAFGDDMMTDNKLIYGAGDVIYLGVLYYDQIKELQTDNLMKIADLENEVLITFGDMAVEGCKLDVPKWLSNITKAKPIVQEAGDTLNSVLAAEPFRTHCTETVIPCSHNGRKFNAPMLLTKDTNVINWGSSKQKLEVLKLLFPDLEKSSSVELKNYLQVHDAEAPKDCSAASKKFIPYIQDLKPNKFVILKLLILKQYEAVNECFETNYRDDLVQMGYLLPKDKCVINWNSTKQVLGVLKCIDPEIESTDADTVAANYLKNPKFFKNFSNYRDATALLTKFGEKFVTEFVEEDGRVRPRFDLIKDTGRVSCSKPNIQQVPKNKLPKENQGDYRSCFVPNYPGWSWLSLDYKSQELAVIAALSGEESWIEALESGQDLHSSVAYLMYGQRWIDAAEPDCAFLKLDENGEMQKKKCSCPKHKPMRQGSKQINFGLAYGLSAMGLARDLGTTQEEAEELMDMFYKKFPKITAMINRNMEFAGTNGFILTAEPFPRRRNFPEFATVQEHGNIKGLKGGMERKGSNTPIQGFSANMTKLAMIYATRAIEKANLFNFIKIIFPVHDEINAIAHPNYKDKATVLLQAAMEDAAEYCLNNQLLKSDVDVGVDWYCG